MCPSRTGEVPRENEEICPEEVLGWWSHQMPTAHVHPAGWDTDWAKVCSFKGSYWPASRMEHVPQGVIFFSRKETQKAWSLPSRDSWNSKGNGIERASSKWNKAVAYKFSWIKNVWAYMYVHIYAKVMYAINHTLENLKNKINIFKALF